MSKAVHLKGTKSIRMPMSNISKLIDLFESHGLTDEFHNQVPRARLSLDPMLCMLADRNMNISNLFSGRINTRSAFQSIAAIKALVDDHVLVSSLEDTYLEMSPKLVNSIKDFIASKALDEHSALAAQVIGKCVTPVPYHCPKWF